MATCACGDYADTRHAFGYAICSRCYDAEDDAIEQVERRDARRLGVRYGWSDDEQPRSTPSTRSSPE